MIGRLEELKAPRRPHRDRRLRHRLLVAQLPAPLPGRHAQDRPGVRRGARHERRSGAARRRDPAPRLDARPRHHRGGDRVDRSSATACARSAAGTRRASSSRARSRPTSSTPCSCARASRSAHTRGVKRLTCLAAAAVVAAVAVASAAVGSGSCLAVALDAARASRSRARAASGRALPARCRRRLPRRLGPHAEDVGGLGEGRRAAPRRRRRPPARPAPVPGDRRRSPRRRATRRPRRPTARAPVVYGAAFRTKGRIDLQYWLWYPYNDYSPTVPAGDLWQVHEGDWEAVSVILDASGRPLVAGYSQHSEGRRRDWARVPKRGLRPLVYVALGSHANYFSAGDAAASTRASSTSSSSRSSRQNGQKAADHTGKGRVVRPKLVRVLVDGAGVDDVRGQVGRGRVPPRPRRSAAEAGWLWPARPRVPRAVAAPGDRGDVLAEGLSRHMTRLERSRAQRCGSDPRRQEWSRAADSIRANRKRFEAHAGQKSSRYSASSLEPPGTIFDTMISSASSGSSFQTDRHVWGGTRTAAPRSSSTTSSFSLNCSFPEATK